MSQARVTLPLRLDLPPRSPDVVPFLESTGLATASFPWQLRPPVPCLVVVAKATFAIVDRGLATWCADAESLAGDEPNEEGESLRRASDFAPYKPKADLTLVGHAYPHGGRGESSHVVFGFGAHRFRMAVLGDRAWVNGVPTGPTSFEKMPLVWERAYGGVGSRSNPLGRGAEGRRLPNLANPDRLMRSPSDTPEPVCFAPTSRDFPERQAKLGTYDAAWQATRWPYFPKDFDWGYMNAAPKALQLDDVRGDEPFELAGVHPALPVITGQLPGLRARVFALGEHEGGLSFQELTLRLDTVAFDADAMTVSLVWRGALEVSRAAAPELTRLYALVEPIANPTPIADVFARMTLELTQRFGAQVIQPLGAPKVVERKARVQPAPPAVRMDPAVTAAMLAETPELAGADFAGHDLRGVDFSGRDLRSANFVGARLDGARFDKANLTGAVFTRAYAPSASFGGANLLSANFAEAVLTSATFDGATLELASAAECFAAGASFADCTLNQANFTDALLDGAAFDRVVAHGLGLSGASLRSASFAEACLEDAQLYEIDGEGARFDSAKAARVRVDGARLLGASFNDADAIDASFEGANLERAHFERATLSGAVLAHANLTRAVLDRATATSARFRGACFASAFLRRANLMEASFDGADLRRADLRGSNLYGCDLNGAELEGAALDGALLGNTRLSST